MTRPGPRRRQAAGRAIGFHSLPRGVGFSPAGNFHCQGRKAAHPARTTHGEGRPEENQDPRTSLNLSLLEAKAMVRPK